MEYRNTAVMMKHEDSRHHVASLLTRHLASHSPGSCRTLALSGRLLLGWERRMELGSCYYSDMKYGGDGGPGPGCVGNFSELEFRCMLSGPNRLLVFFFSSSLLQKKTSYQTVFKKLVLFVSAIFHVDMLHCSFIVRMRI